MSSQDPRLSFNRVAKAYGLARPSYPAQIFDALFAMLPAEPEIVEVGPGSGQATVDLVARGARVHAIELGPQMAAELQARVRTDRLRVSVGDFEVVPRAAAVADAVFSATAYHWVSAKAQMDRPAELLRPGGTLAVVDTTQVESPDDHGYFAASQPIYDRYGQGASGFVAPRRDQVAPPIAGALAGDSRYSEPKVLAVDWNQTYTAAQYRQLMLSYSTTQMMEPDAREALLDDLDELIVRDFGGMVTRPLVVTLTTAQLV